MKQFLTDRKRAIGLGSGHEGTRHHWQMMVSSMAMVLAVPVFLVTFALGFQGDHAAITTYFGQPLVAILMALCLVVILRHVMFEAQEAIEDYVHGIAGKLALVAVTWLSYILIGLGLFALARLAI